jgi:hypothetical protein
MGSVTLELSEGLATVINLKGPGVRPFFSHPGRVLAALLNRNRLRRVGPSRFRYCSRPVAVGPWELRPELEFLADWNGTEMSIRLEHCRLHGFPGSLSQPPVRFEMEAVIRPMESELQAEATTRLSIPEGSAVRLLPRPLLQLLGRQALLACLARLESRCQARLPLVAKAWIQRGGDRIAGAEDIP